MTAIELIAAERKLQIEKEGWSPEHDDGHTEGQLADAAACYAATTAIYIQSAYSVNGRGKSFVFADAWPFDVEWDKRPRDGRMGDLKEPTEKQRLRMLVKAGALIVAEIERLQRAKPSA